jgi:pectate lyase
MKSQYFLIALCCIVTTLLAGCGSSSHITNPSPSTPTNINGIFADAPVVGLSYSCGSTSDVTKAGGAFTCPASSTVTFKIGGITICSAPAQAFMTPVSCA